MKCVITGAKGQLGYDLVKELKQRGYNDIIALGHKDLDITDKDQLSKIFYSLKPDVVFHCAAYTKVDQAEDDKDNCYKVNVDATKNIATICKRINAKLIYISTDYVFDGFKEIEKEYYPDDTPRPLSIYGMTKFLGEQYTKINPKTYVVRISWVFGINGKNFIKTMLRLAETRNELNVVNDQIGSPTYTVDLSKLLVDMAETDKYGIYHATNNGFCTWADLAEYAFEINNLDLKVNRITSIEYPQKAKRPLNSKLNKDKLIENGFLLLPDWEDAVFRFNEELKQEKVLRK